MEVTFQEVIALRAAQAGCANAYDAWAQREQARVLIEYADWQKQNAASRARIVMSPASLVRSFPLKTEHRIGTDFQPIAEEILSQVSTSPAPIGSAAQL
jgi:accessory colonization factor AcfC